MRANGSSGSHWPQNSWSHSNSSSTNFGSSSNNSSWPTCQIYNHPGHGACDCFQRMNHAYEGRIPTQKLMAIATTTISLNNSHTHGFLILVHRIISLWILQIWLFTMNIMARTKLLWVMVQVWILLILVLIQFLMVYPPLLWIIFCVAHLSLLIFFQFINLLVIITAILFSSLIVFMWRI